MRPSEKNNKAQDLRPKTRPLLGGTMALRVLCGVLFAVNLWLFYEAFTPGRGISSYRQHRQRVQDLEQKIAAIRMENQKLFRQIQNFKNDPQVQERAARQQLGWARQDELVIEFLPPAKDPS